MSEQESTRVHQFLRNWAFVIGVFLTVCAALALTLLVVVWPMMVAVYFGYSDTELLAGETVWTYVQLAWGFLVVTTGTALMVTIVQVKNDE